MKPAIETIFETFGGIRPFARAIGRTASTVQYWREAQFLPRSERERVTGALIERGMAKRKAERTVERAIAGVSATPVREALSA